MVYMTAQHRQEEGEGLVVVLGAAVAAEAARLDGGALEATAGTHTSRRSKSFQEAK